MSMDDRRQRPREGLTGSAPGPLQRQILRILHAARGEKIDGLSAKKIAGILTAVYQPVSEGNVLGALSGMQDFRQRHWVGQYCTPPGVETRYVITRNGLAWI